MRKLLVLTRAHHSTEAFQILSRNFATVFPENEFNRRDVECLWIDYSTRIDELMLEVYPNIKQIVTLSTATTHIDENLTMRRSIKVYSLKTHRLFLDTEISSSSEFAWTLLLSANAGLYGSESYSLRESNELSRARLQLKSARLGIIGMGRIGQNCARYANVFGMEVFYADPKVQILDNNTNAKYVSNLSDLLNICDYIILSASISGVCREILDSKVLTHRLKLRGIINISRGCLVDESRILELLDSGSLGYYATDVLGIEEFPNLPNRIEAARQLNQHPHCLVTPHIGGLSFDARCKVEEHMASYIAEGICSCSQTGTQV